MQRKAMVEKNAIRQWREELSGSKQEQKNAGLWQYAYKIASRPRRQRVIVNLGKIEKIAKAGENIIIPGKVLGVGNLSKSLNITAMEYSDDAAEKVVKAGGRMLGLKEMMKQESVRIII